MKLRLRTNSVRFRVGKSEVDSLRRGLECHEVISFPGGKRLQYSLVPSVAATIEVLLDGAVLTVGIPCPDLAAWCNSDQVGLSAQIPLADDAGTLHVLIEKDFRCLDMRVLEDQSDTFDNPMMSHPACE